jgi:GntR family transcriptional regulator/MocR family aminotransferase
MAKAWATSGVDLHLELADRRGRAALEQALRDAVRSGRLAPGTRLPSSRALGQDLGVARNTIVEVYGQLVAEGWLTATTGSGTAVAQRFEPEPRSRRAAPRTPAVAPARYDLRPGYPDLSTFPRTEWLAAARRALAAAPAEAFGYGDPRGRPELRTALAGYLARARGVRCDPGRVLVCAGFSRGLSLLCEVLRDAGVSTVVTEAYGHGVHRDLVAGRGLRVREAAVDERGAVVDSFGDAGAALLTPAHQFPLGVILGAERRTQAAQWARASGALIVEDDYDGEFRYDRQAIGAMQALSPQQIAYAGTASKTLAPGLRLGWLVLPAALVDDVVAAKARSDRHESVVDQLTLAELISSGGYDRHIRRCRLRYRRRRDRLVTLLRDRAPRVRVAGVAAGMHAVLELPEGCDEDDVVERGRGRGVALRGLREFTMPGHVRPPALVVGFGTPPEHAFTGALSRLAATLVG